MRKFSPGLLFLFFLVFIAGHSFAALSFPALTGRVVDDAHILSGPVIERLDRELGDYERGTGNQVVVVTLRSLQGDAIEDYGYQLGRAWQIGRKDNNNGVLLIIAPVEHKVRIEVGYGLEGVLTDAASSAIIQTVILPDFRKGQMEQGVLDGTRAILDVLGGKSAPSDRRAENRQTGNYIPLIYGGLIFIFLAIRMLGFAGGIFKTNFPLFALLSLMSSGSRYSSSGGFSGGSGFSGGGGSFGGGGASGSW